MQLADTGSPASGGGFVIRPTVTLAILYLGILAVWFLWILLTSRGPASEGDAPFRLITWTQFLGVTLGDLLLFACLAVDGYRCRTSPPGLRRGHLAGILLALLGLVVVQLGVVFLYGPIAVG